MSSVPGPSFTRPGLGGLLSMMKPSEVTVVHRFAVLQAVTDV